MVREPTSQFRERVVRFIRDARTTSDQQQVWYRALLIALASVVALTILGPLGSDALTFWPRLAYWFVGMVGGTLIGVIVVTYLRDRIGWADRPILTGLIAAAILTGPISLLIWAISSIGLNNGVFDLEALGFDIVPVFTVSWCMCAINLLAQRQPIETHTHPADNAAPRFLERLPPKLCGAELWAVEAEDHYLRLHTSQGSDLVLMRLSDAISELDGIEGAQTHRSWWIARRAVKSAELTNGRASLSLADGTIVPVSRTYIRALRTQGWFSQK
jgi:hypothetical protein